MAGERKSPASKKSEGEGSASERSELLRRQALQLLLRASELIGQPSGWTRGHLARDRHSKPVSPWSKRAVRVCVGGALLRATQEQLDVEFLLARPGEKADTETGLWLARLREAHHLLGRTMETLFLRPTGIAVREHGRGEETLISLVDAQGEPVEDWAPEDAMTWRSLVQVLNDDRQLGHSEIRDALTITAAINYRKADPSASKEAEAKGGS